MPDDEAVTGQEAQQQLSASVEQYQRMVRGIGEYAIFMLSQGNRIMTWNKGVHRILGYSEHEFVGASGDMLFVPEDRAKGAPEKERDEAASTGQAADNRWHLRKDGSRFWANGIMTALYTAAGEPDGFVKVLRDNTGEKLAEEALQSAHDELEARVQERTKELLDMNEQLRRSEMRFAAAFRFSPFAAVITTPDEDSFIEVNDAFCRLTGYSPEEARGRTAQDLQMWSSREDRERLAQATKDGSGFRDLELSLHTKDGDKRGILLSMAAIPNEGGNVLLKMFFDITERKRSEEELRKAIEAVMQDASWFSRILVEKLAQVRSGVSHMPAIAELTPRERQVLILIAKGKNNEEIAEDLGLRSQTVRNYVASIYSKISVRSRAAAVVWARERGLV